MPKNIALPADVVAVVLDVLDSMNTPSSNEEMALSFRRAYWLQPIIEDAFSAAGIDPDKVPRPEIPPMVPGSDYHG